MIMEGDLDLLLKYPLISCEIRNGIKHYDGIITVENNDYEIHVIEDNKDGNPVLKLLSTFGKEIVGKTDAGNVVKFLDEVSTFLSTSHGQCDLKNNANTYKKVLHEYTEFRKFHLNVNKSEISADLSTILATTLDEGGRQHSLKINIDFEEINIYRVIDFKLPEQVCKDFSKNFGNLTDAFGKFLSTLDLLQPFFDVMDDLDRYCCVLDPEIPSRKDCYRRIWLEQNLSVMITVDPINVRRRPDLKFLGPEHLILQYRGKLNDNLDKWDENTGLVEGLLNILDMETFPSKPQSHQEMLMDTGECSICFSLRFNDKLPEVVCSNDSCQKFYHINCLYEWLTSINSKRIFNEIRGECPNCEKGISCPLPDRASTT